MFCQEGVCSLVTNLEERYIHSIRATELRTTNSHDSHNAGARRPRPRPRAARRRQQRARAAPAPPPERPARRTRRRRRDAAAAQRREAAARDRGGCGAAAARARGQHEQAVGGRDGQVRSSPRARCARERECSAHVRIRASRPPAAQGCSARADPAPPARAPLAARLLRLSVPLSGNVCSTPLTAQTLYPP